MKDLEFNGFLLSTDKSKLQHSVIHRFLVTSYWAPGIPLSVLDKSIEHSLCIGIYKGDAQIGFARIITDYATFGYLADVFIDEKFRGLGLSKVMMEFVFSFDFVPGLRRFMLATLDAHGLYKRSGFKTLERPDRFMEINKPGIYTN